MMTSWLMSGLPRQLVEMKLNSRCSISLRGAGREVAADDLKAGLVGEALDLEFPQPGTGAVGSAAVGGNRQCGGVRIALFAELRPPVEDRVHGKRGRVARDPDRDPTFVGDQVIDAVGDRVPELLVLEVVGADLNRLAFRLEFASDGLEIADQLSLLGVHADHRLPS